MKWLEFDFKIAIIVNNNLQLKLIKMKKLINGKDRKEMREYYIWKAMRSRVKDFNRPDSIYYAQKGIKICESWDSFEQFYKDMGDCPENYSIDRIDPNKGYCPENCRWASKKTQSQNRGEFNKVFTYNGETHVLKEWAAIYNIKYTTLYNRIYRSNLSFEKAIQKDPFHRLVEFNGEKKTMKEWCSIYNIEYNVVINRLDKHKWSLKDALTIPKGGRRKNQTKI